MNSCGTKSNSDTVPTSMPPIVATASEREPLQPTPVENIIGSFDQDSYGYRPNRSAFDAIAKARERCFKFGWVFERYADDTICHCVSKAQAEYLKEVLT